MTAQFEAPNEGNRVQAATPQSQPRTERAQRNDQDDRSSRSARRESIANLESRHARPMSIRGNSDVLNSYRDGIQGALDREISGTYKGNFGVRAFDKQQIKTAYSVLLVYFNEQVGDRRISSVFKLILAPTGTQLLTKKLTYNGQNYTHIRVPADLDGEKLNQKLETGLFETFGRQTELVDAGTLTVFGTIDPKDNDAMAQIAGHATTACWEILARVTNETEEPFSRNSLGESDQLSVNIDDNPVQLIGIDGQPVRSDIRITLSGSEKGTRDQDNDDAMHSASQDLTEIDTYIDLLHRGDEAYKAKPQYSRNNREIFAPLYQPVINITNIQNRVSMMTPELALLAIATSSVLADDGEWMLGLKQRFDDRRAGIRDIGALGIEWDQYRDERADGKRIDTAAADFDARAFRDLVDEMMTQYPVIRLQVAVGGPMSWMLGSLGQAADGDDSAVQAWFKAADNVSLGHFGDFFRNYDGLNIVHRIDDMGLLATYTDEKGVRRDAREVDDYLAIQNLYAENNQDVVGDWANTHEAFNVPVDVRLAKRTEILRHATRDTLEVNGRYEIYEVDGIFLKALVAGLVKSRMDITAGNLMVDYRSGHNRGSSNSGRNALDSSVGGLWNRGGSGFDRNDRGSRGSAFGRGSRGGGSAW